MKLFNTKLNLIIKFLLILFSLSSCKTEDDSARLSTSPNEIFINKDIKFINNIFEIIEEVEITELSSNPKDKNFSIDYLKNIILYKNHFYSQSKSDKLYLFNFEGTLQEVLNKKGNGPEEYKTIKDFRINTVSNEVFIYDFEKQNFLIYDLNLNFLRKEKIGFNFLYFYFLDTDIALFTAKHRNNINETYLDNDLIVVDKDFNIQSTALPFEASLFTSTRLHKSKPFIQLNNKVLFNDFISDTIYEVSKDTIKYFKHFNYEKQTLNNKLKKGSHEVLLKKYKETPKDFEKLDLFANLLTVNNENIFISTFSRRGEGVFSFFNSKNRKIKYYKFPNKYKGANYEEIFKTKTKNQNKLITLVYPYVLKFLKEQYLKKFNKEGSFTKRIDEILTNTTEDGNQIILSYSLKNI